MTSPNNTAAGLTTTYPYATSPEVARVQCGECGGWARTDAAGKGLAVGEILHSKRCDGRPQIPAVAVLAAVVAEREAQADLRRFAARVRRTGSAQGRDADVLECVRLGLLSQSEAMNTDD